jgi:hypothetical protein
MRAHSNLRRTLCLFVIVLTALAGQTALAAKKRVVVLGFSGPSASRVRRGLVRAMNRRVRMVASRRYRRAARRLRVQAATEAGVAASCTKVRCHAVISGSVKRSRRGRYLVSVVVRDGGTGRILGRASARIRGRRRLARAGRTLAREVLKLVRKGSLGRRAPPEPPVASEPRPPAWAEEQSGEDSPPARAPEAEDTALSERMFGGDDPAEAPEDERGDDDSGDTDADLSQRTVVGPGADALWVSAALGFAMRSFEQSGGDRLTRYEGEAYPELTLSAEVYPGLGLPHRSGAISGSRSPTAVIFRSVAQRISTMREQSRERSTAARSS